MANHRATRITKAQREREQNAADYIGGGDVNMSMLLLGDMNMWGTFPSAPTFYQKPLPQIFYMTRNWYERTVFLKSMTLLKYDIYNFGFKLQARPLREGATKAEQKEWDKANGEVQDWHEANDDAVAELNRDAWREWNIQDNMIGIWMKGLPPVIYPLEHVSYTNDFGVEKLNFSHGLTAPTIAGMTGLTAEVRKALQNSKTVTLQKQGTKRDPKAIYGFETARRTNMGMGLAWPQLRTLFNTVCSWEALELADMKLADAMRTVYELHKVGHEIKNGPRAGMQDNFLKKKRFEAINKLIKGDAKMLAAIKQLVVNFDHEIEYPRVDPKHFGKERYESALQRMMLWCAPIADMLFAKQINPWHGNFLKAKAHSERDQVGRFLKNVMIGAMGAPKQTVCVWSDDIFIDPRLLMDTLKTGLQAGPISQATFLDKTGHDVQKERSRKDAENELPDHIVKPRFDAAHGDKEEGAGRPPGKGNAGARKPRGG